MMNLLQSGVASAERVFELLDADQQVPDSTTVAPPAGRGEVRFEHVSFSYDPAEPLIEDLSLVASPGQTVAIVGPDRRRQDHAGQPGDALLRAGRRPDHPRRHRHHRDAARRPARPDRDGAPGHLAVRGHDPRQHRLRPPRRHRGGDPRGRAGDVRRPVRALAARRLRHASSTRTAATCPPASGSCSPSPGPSSPTRRC